MKIKEKTPKHQEASAHGSGHYVSILLCYTEVEHV